MNARTGRKEQTTVIGSVVKALNVLSQVAKQPAGASASEVARALGMPAPSAYHLLNTLTLHDALTKGKDRRYRLGPRIGSLSGAYYSQAAPDERLVLPLIDLAQLSGETTYLTVWRGREIEVTASAEGSSAVRVPGLALGSHSHAHARASGKLLLALAPGGLRDAYLSRHERAALTKNTITDRQALRSHLERIAEVGHAFDNEEFAQGVSCVAVPVTRDGLLIGAYTISGPSERFLKNRDEWLAAAKRAAHLATGDAGEKPSSL